MDKITKRLVLSRISQIYDPLGLLGPVVVNGKLFMQEMWKVDVSWDERLPIELQESWKQYYHSLNNVNGVQIPRNINPENNEETFDLVGFGDASEKAFGACIYALSRNKEGIRRSRLITSKSKVAPIKTIFLPRLELNAVHLLAKLCNVARQAYGNKINEIYLWSDSTTVLSWIKSSPSIRKTYVANRVTKIQNLSEGVTWLHVTSKDNPADLLSRGISVSDWKTNNLWWHGPDWLVRDKWPQQQIIEDDKSEMKSTVVLLSTQVHQWYEELINRFSSYDKLVRIIAYCLRMRLKAKGGKQRGHLSVKELNLAEVTLLRMIQCHEFHLEIIALKRQRGLPKGSKLAALAPFIDENRLIRVGGRIQKADISEETKHPIVLPAKHHVTYLIFEKEHIRLHHCGSELLLSSVRQKYWPLNGRQTARKIIRRCLSCFKNNPKPTEVFMGNLPIERVQCNFKPFTNTGIDYAGPFQTKESKRRGRVHVYKSWIAVFVCLATKAVHLELVTELTTEAFLAALRRFIARRGRCSRITSDNGTNFVGAARELKEVYEFLNKNQNTIEEYLVNQKLQWKFIPPRAPNFGGLWEATVKITKKHLYTVTKGLTFTFEEGYTLLTEIESILNSRPLTPISEDPNNLGVLTPGHFLVGESLVAPAEYDISLLPVNKLSRWQHLQKIRQHLWKRWHRDYLPELQKRAKWRTSSNNLKTGDLVLIKEDNAPPLQWRTGRVTEVCPGPDGVVRVVILKTANGQLKRAVNCLCPLPIEDDENNTN